MTAATQTALSCSVAVLARVLRPGAPFLVETTLTFPSENSDAQQILDGLLQYQVAANPRSTRRFAATLLTTRPQSLMPHATDVPEISTVVFRRPDGDLDVRLIYEGHHQM